MKRILIFLLVLAAQSVIPDTFDAVSASRSYGNAYDRVLLLASAPEIELDPEVIEKTEETGNTTIVGCDNSAWETAAYSAGQKELVGTWVGNERNRAGEWSITFTYSGRFEMKGPDGEWHDGRYACDGKRDPRILNLYIKESSNSALVGQTFLMIYRADSTTLNIASGEPGAKTRPVEFNPSNGIRVFVVTKPRT